MVTQITGLILLKFFSGMDRNMDQASGWSPLNSPGVTKRNKEYHQSAQKCPPTSHPAQITNNARSVAAVYKATHWKQFLHKYNQI